MVEFIIQYWVECLFGLIVAVVGGLYKRYQTLHKKEQEQGRKEFKEALIEAMNEHTDKQLAHFEQQDILLQKQLNVQNESLEVLKAGVLAMQGKEFKQKCLELLEPDHIITVSEYDQIIKDHEAYHGLGGNSDGDVLFHSVCVKFDSEN